MRLEEFGKEKLYLEKFTGGLDWESALSDYLQRLNERYSQSFTNSSTNICTEHVGRQVVDHRVEVVV